MFDGIFYFNKLVYIDKKGNHVLCQPIATWNNDDYVLCRYIDANNNYVLFTINDMAFQKLRARKIYLKEELLNLGYNEKDFINPIGRTKKIVKAINKIDK